MMSILILVKNDILRVFNKKTLLLILIMSLFILLPSIKKSWSYYSIIFNIFSGSYKTITKDLVGNFQWLLHQITLFYILFNFLSEEINNNYIYKITRIRNISKWFFSKIISLFVIIAIYYLLYLVFIGIYYLIINHNPLFNYDAIQKLNYNNMYIKEDLLPVLVTNSMSLVIFSSFLLSIIGFAIIIISTPFIAIIFTTLLEVLSLSNVSISKHFPSRYGIFHKDVFFNNILGRYLYIIILAIFFLILCSILIKRKSIWK